jgi:hypothetical protein
MTNRRFALKALGIGALALLAATSSDARVGRTDFLTFSGAVALPGVTLAAGEYTFEAVEGSAGVVRVRSGRFGDSRFLGYTERIRRPSGLPAGRAVTFGEAPAGGAPPITAWYELGSNDGHRFIYDRR